MDRDACAVIGCVARATVGLYCESCADQARQTREEIARRFPGGPLCEDCAALARASTAGADREAPE